MWVRVHCRTPELAYDLASLDIQFIEILSLFNAVITSKLPCLPGIYVVSGDMNSGLV